MLHCGLRLLLLLLSLVRCSLLLYVDIVGLLLLGFDLSRSRSVCSARQWPVEKNSQMKMHSGVDLSFFFLDLSLHAPLGFCGGDHFRVVVIVAAVLERGLRAFRLLGPSSWWSCF